MVTRHNATVRYLIPALGVAAAAIVVTFVELSPAPPTDATADLDDRLGFTRYSGVRPRDFVPELSARTIDGAEVSVHFADAKPGVLYVLAPSCQWCTHNYDNISALAEATSHRYRFVGISEDHNEILRTIFDGCLFHSMSLCWTSLLWRDWTSASPRKP